MAPKYISKRATVGLENYKYHGVDASLFSGLLQPYWNFCVTLLPMWMAPNLVTFTGFVFIAIASALVYWDNWDLQYQSINGWIYVVLSACVFFYQTMDSIDGKQARRTKSSSPLGELFDHGCDAIVTVWMSMNFLCSIQLSGEWAYLFMFIAVLTSYFFIWEQYHTNQLRFGYLNSPTEALILNIVLFLVIGLFPDHATTWWKFQIGFLQLNQWFVVVGSFISATTLIPSTINAFKASGNPSRNYPLFSLFPIFVTLIGFSLFLWTAPQLLIDSPLLTLLAFGLLSSYHQTRMIVSRVCDEPIIVAQFITLPLPIILLHQFLFPVVNPTYILYAYLLFIVSVYVHFVHHTIQEICEYLGIYCFTLKKRQEVKID